MMLPLVEDRKSIGSIPRALVVPKYSIAVFAVAIIVLFVVASGSSPTGTLVSKPIDARAAAAAAFSSAAGRFPLPLTAVGALIVEAGGMLARALALALVLALVSRARAAALRRPRSSTVIFVFAGNPNFHSSFGVRDGSARSVSATQVKGK